MKKYIEVDNIYVELNIDEVKGTAWMSSFNKKDNEVDYNKIFYFEVNENFTLEITFKYLKRVLECIFDSKAYEIDFEDIENNE